MGVKEMIAAAKAREEAAKAEKALKPAPAPRVFVKKHAADSLPAPLAVAADSPKKPRGSIHEKMAALEANVNSEEVAKKPVSVAVPGGSIKERMAAMQRQTNERSVGADAPAAVPGGSIKERMAAMQRQTSERSVGADADAAPTSPSPGARKSLGKSSGIAARLAKMQMGAGGGGLSGMGMPMGMTGMMPPTLPPRRPLVEAPVELNHATRTRVAAPKHRRPKTTSFDTARLEEALVLEIPSRRAASETGARPPCLPRPDEDADEDTGA